VAAATDRPLHPATTVVRRAGGLGWPRAPRRTYAAPQSLRLFHVDPTAIIWYTVTETDDPDAAPNPEMFGAESFLDVGDVELDAGLAPSVVVKARPYVTDASGQITAGPVSTVTYGLTMDP
jgi:hypothetical protein